MQISRLLEIVYILLDKRTVTANELSRQFEVSQRTIYRDIEALGAAGIPVYTSKGRGGGISLLDNYVLNKTMLSEREQVSILSSLQGLNALNVPDTESALQKLSTFFNKNYASWIDVDLSRWKSDPGEPEKFRLLKEAILNRCVIGFDYYSASCEMSKRTVEPMKILFKGQGWYLYGFCRTRNDYRVFKVTRMKNLACTRQTFTGEIPAEINIEPQSRSGKTMDIVLKVDGGMAYRLYDEFDPDNIKRNADGSFNVSASFPDDEWVYEYLMSYGEHAEVLEPKHVRGKMKGKIGDCLKKYL